MMEQRVIPRGRITAIVALSLLVFLSGCNDNGTEPELVKYNVYLGSSVRGILYVLDLDSLTIIDSIPDMGHVADIAVSPDGRWIYAESYWPPRRMEMTKIDARTHEKVAVLPNDAVSYLTQLKNGELLLEGGDFCKVELVDPAGPTVIGTLADSICGLRGPLTGTKVAARIGGTSRIRVVDVESGEVYGEYIAHLDQGRTLHAADCVLHPDGRRVLAIGTTAGQLESWFLIGDVETGETLLQHQLYKPQGRVAISNDGTLAAVTDPSNMGHWETPPIVDIFDLESMTHLKRFSSTTGDLEALAGQAEFLPGDRQFLTTPPADGTSSGVLHLFDVENLTVDRIVWLPVWDDLGGAMTIGIRP